MQIKFSKSPPPQMKTLRIQIVFLYRGALVPVIDREGNRKLCSEFKFSYIGGTGRENFCSVVSFVLLRRFFDYVYLYKS